MNTPCIEWQGSRDKDGYGWDGRKKAHRTAWERTNGPIPRGLVVRHRCDNPPCVNPEHLDLGDHRDNARDRGERNADWRRRNAEHLRKHGRRNAPGEGTLTAKLTAKQVAEIRRLYKPNPRRRHSSLSQREIAKMFGVAQSTISQAVSGSHWGPEAGVAVPPFSSLPLLTIAQVAEIRRRYATGGISQQALADEFDVHQMTVSRIVQGRTY